MLFDMGGRWHQVRRDDIRARRLADRHYSRQTPGAKDFMASGRTLVLLTDDERAVWGAIENLDPVGNRRWRCSIFRNEGAGLSSELIREATTRTIDFWRRRHGLPRGGYGFRRKSTRHRRAPSGTRGAVSCELGGVASTSGAGSSFSRRHMMLVESWPVVITDARVGASRLTSSPWRKPERRRPLPISLARGRGGGRWSGMAFSWFRAESSAVDHPKVMDLAGRLGVELALADGYVFRLWSWVHRYAPSGTFDARLVPQLESYLGRTGVIAMMREARLLEGSKLGPDGLEVHDWWEMQGALVEKAEKDSLRKRQKRRADGARTARGRRADGARTARVQDRTGQDTTRHDMTDISNAPLSHSTAPLSRTRVVSDALCAAFAELRGSAYKFTGAKDGAALARLLKACALDSEIERRWRTGLQAHGWREVNTIAQLDSKWNDLTAGGEKAFTGTGQTTATEGTL